MIAALRRFSLFMVFFFLGCRKDDLLTLPVILVDLDGHTVKDHKQWNITTTGDHPTYPQFHCTPSGLTPAGDAEVLATIQNAFSEFLVRVTSDTNIFNKAPSHRRTRIIITAYHHWYGTHLGGAAAVNAYGRMEVGGFVFSDLQRFNVKHIAQSAVHELGHVFGLRHRAVYDTSCRKLTDYDRGDGTTAPYMGDSRKARDGGTWGVGPTSLGCKNIQHERDTIRNRLSL